MEAENTNTITIHLTDDAKLILEEAKSTTMMDPEFIVNRVIILGGMISRMSREDQNAVIKILSKYGDIAATCTPEKH